MSHTSQLVSRQLGDHPSQDIAGQVVLPIVATLAVALRVFLRKRNRIGLWWDDYLIVLSMPLLWALWALLYYTETYFVDPQLLLPKPDSKQKYYLCSYIANIIFNTVQATVKISILLLYKRAFGVTKTTRYIIYGLIVFNTSFAICSLVGTIVDCQPVENYWKNPEACAKDAARMITFFKTVNLLGLVADLVLLLFPIPFIYRIRASTTQKVIIGILFLMGGVSCFSCAMRIYILFDGFKEIADLKATFPFALLAVSFFIEIGVAVVAISLSAVLAPLGALIKGSLV